ncbi:MAG: Tol-Pal system protein TolB [Gammaproteobacteria bacterium]|nr:Tol-Pal system protein TolB [Gammaproteobacteria bacterium]NND39920.1 Tol-Pal system protein TolB [Pseudomonadales bacterium]MBT8150818.1 Tol-Pal system protein TolB [Gammaproteobacteria bacterium]NNL11876.1 Tol-Pal system protein TolB [Pseudomonadales bacterium]NNM11539.1 Tol-Pal system protein TolB [Pseudomonadales bacterium]
MTVRALKQCLFSLVCVYMVVIAAPLARANLLIEVTEGVDNPTRIAVVPFAHSGAPIGLDLASVVAADLMRSGRFEVLPRDAMLSTPRNATEVVYRDWRSLNVEYLLIGRSELAGDELVLDIELFDVIRQRPVLSQRVQNISREMRAVAHGASDQVYEKLTGIEGVFGTRMAYVSVTGAANNRMHRLIIADADGARPREILRSKEPILSPDWSPDGEHLAYVSFESSRPAIYRQNLASGEREQLTAFRGLNGAPAWSPDGRRMAMVLSKDGNPEVYVMDLASKALKRVTRHFSIDTEPDWTPDGKALVFTSDRGGQPQIYRVDIETGKVKRITFRGNYNAAAQMLADGKSMVMVHQQNGEYHIAWQEIETGRLLVLTRSFLDESPSIAPNGSMLLFATKQGNKGVLAAVALDGGFKYRLPSPDSDVREPAWSPKTR